MKVLESQHAYLTSYEVLQVIKLRKKFSKPYSDGRDVEYLGNFQRVDKARSLMYDSLLTHSPDGTSNDKQDNIGEKILQFSNSIQKLLPNINAHQIRSLIAIRPRNQCELASIFSTPEEWTIVAMNVDDILNLINNNFKILN